MATKGICARMRLDQAESRRDIPTVTNWRGEALVNSELAHRLGIEISLELPDAASGSRLF